VTTALVRLRRICLELPEAEERETWAQPTFRVRGKIFAMFVGRDGTPSLWCKAPQGAQTILTEADPARFFRPPYVGHKGWIGVRLNAAVDWEEVAGLVRRSFAMTAPRRLLGQPGVEERNKNRNQPDKRRPRRANKAGNTC
jgi:hypothetical protein